MRAKSHNASPWVVALTVTLATFMELLDTSIANVSLPNIAGGLGRSFDEVTWILTTYLVANAVILPMSAWLSRVFGRKAYYMTCVALFTVTSFLCGIAPTLPFILIARTLQGIGGGRAGSCGAGHPGGYVSTCEASSGVRPLYDCDCHCSCDRPGAGRMDYG